MKFLGVLLLLTCCLRQGISQKIPIFQFVDGSTNIETNFKNLDVILQNDEIKNRNVSVFSITGDARTGKSFIMNFFLKYLNAHYLDRSSAIVDDWIGENSPSGHYVLNEFPWKYGSRSCTKGMDMWSRVFTYDYPNGEKIAIIIIDTQGIFDPRLNGDQSNIIFSLSTLISSTQIYNVMGNVQENHLVHLDLFSEYASMINNRTNENPFQKILFLVRDWIDEEEGYGSINGNRILEEVLEIRSDLSDSQRDLRSRIRSSFEKIEAYMMPAPGQAVRRKSYNGDLNSIETEFKTHIKQLSEELFSPEKLLKMKNGHDYMTVQFWYAYLKGCIRTYESTTLPEATVLLGVNEIVNASIEAEKYYVDEMNSIDTSHLTKNEYEKYHNMLKATAISKLKSSDQLNDDILRLYFENEFKKKIESRWKTFESNPNLQWNAVTTPRPTVRAKPWDPLPCIARTGMGAAAGAAIGSIVPGVGTAIGAVLGGLFGGGATYSNIESCK